MAIENPRMTSSIELLQSFACVQKNIFHLMQKSAADNSLSVPQYSILMTLISDSAMTQKTIGEKTFLPKSTLSQAVDGLVKEGLLERKQVEGNRRKVLLSLSEKGVEFLQTLDQKDSSVLNVFQTVIKALDPQEVQNLISTHVRITTLLESKEPEEQLK